MNSNEWEAINTKMEKKIKSQQDNLIIRLHVLNANQFGNID